MKYSSRFSRKNDTSKYGAGVVISVGNQGVQLCSSQSENTRKVSPSPSPYLASLTIIIGSWVELQERERYHPSLQLCPPGQHLAELSVRSELLDRVLKRGESLSSVTLISLLIFNLNSLQFGCNTEAECSQPRTPQSYSSV